MLNCSIGHTTTTHADWAFLLETSLVSLASDAYPDIPHHDNELEVLILLVHIQLQTILAKLKVTMRKVYPGGPWWPLVALGGPLPPPRLL